VSAAAGSSKTPSTVTGFGIATATEACSTSGTATRDIGNHHLVSGFRAQLAGKLADSTQGLLPGVVFGVSGGEATDVAIKLARSRRPRYTVVSAAGACHGHTGLAVAAGDPPYRDPFGPNLPGFVQVPFNDLDAMSDVVDENTAAVILEPVPAALGVVIPEPGYLAGVERICRDAGALFIVDEVQTGLGRTGSFWYYQQEGLRPDIVTTGKGLSGGLYPMTATLMTAELLSLFDEHPFVHLSTAGGAEIGCLSAMAVLDVVNEPGFLAHVRELADRFAAGLAGGRYEVRQRGLFMGLRFPEDNGGVEAAMKTGRNGVFTVFAGNDPSVLQFLPPLVLTDDEADEIIRLVRHALG
jgi:acetylornithine/succinyldiaminopimelate/putrescine aminotransferase